MFQPRSRRTRRIRPRRARRGAALTAFFNITAAWHLGAEEERVLLGSPPRSTFFKWKSDRAARLSADTLERISYVMGIYKALHILLPTQEMADAWVKKPNTAHGFGGKSALERMLAGRVRRSRRCAPLSGRPARMTARSHARSRSAGKRSIASSLPGTRR